MSKTGDLKETKPEEIFLNNKQSFNRRKKDALEKLDNAKFSCFHVRAIVVSGLQEI
jgi:hypothetical protein